MTIDEAIKHAEEVAKAKEREAKINRNHGGRAYDDEATKCSACAEEHRQLAEWLKELKQLREQELVLDKIREEINSPNRGTCDYFIVDRIEEIIDQYKAESEEV